jgi:hypothetical protein
MPSSRASVLITDAYQRALVALRERTGRLVLAGFALDFDALAPSFARWLPYAERTIEDAQRASALLAGDYLMAYRASETGERARPYALDARTYAGHTPDGRPLRRVLVSSRVAVALGLEHGLGRERAMDWGRARALRVVRQEVLEAARFAQRDLMRDDDRIRGWRRVTSSRACGACLAASTGAIRRTSEVPEAHAACRCVAEPVVRGVEERERRPSGRELFDALSPVEQDALFAGTGGAAKAALVRSGRVPLEALLTREARPRARTTITETPLEALAP